MAELYTVTYDYDDRVTFEILIMNKSMKSMIEKDLFMYVKVWIYMMEHIE